MNPTRATRYRCAECGELHSRRDWAEECCQPMVYEVTAHVCAECGQEYEDEDEDMARYCCLDEDVVLPPTPAQLEAAGQQRLSL